MEVYEFYLDDSDHDDFADEEIIERDTKSLDLLLADNEKIPFEYEVRQIDDF